MNAFILMLGTIGAACWLAWSIQADRADAARIDPADDEWLGL